MKKEGTEAQRDKGAKRRLFVFGPGIVAAFAISLFVTAKNFTLSQGKPPVIEKQVSLGKGQPVYAPELTFLIGNHKKFQLSEKQAALIKNLHKKYDEDARPLKKELKEATAQLAVYFNEKEKEKNRVAFKDVQEQSQNYQELSRDLSQLRKFYFEQAMNLLSEDQKKLVKSFPTYIDGSDGFTIHVSAKSRGAKLIPNISSTELKKEGKP